MRPMELPRRAHKTASRVFLQDQFLAVSVGEHTFAFEANQVVSVQRGETLEAGLGPIGSLGMIYTRRSEVPVYALAALTGITTELRPPDGRVLIMQAERGSLGIWVDRVLSVEEEAKLVPVPMTKVLRPEVARWYRGVLAEQHTLETGSAQPMFWLSLAALTEPADQTLQLAPAAEQAQGASSQAETSKGLENSPAGSQIMVFQPAAALPELFGCRFTISLTQVAEILPNLPVWAVPGMYAPWKGIHLRHGKAVPLLDFAASLGIHSENRLRPRGMVCRLAHQNQYVALEVASDLQVLRLPLASEPDPDPPPVLSGLVRGCFRTDFGRLAVLDLDRLVAQSQATAPETVFRNTVVH